MGIGVISDRDPQPLIVGSRFGTFAIVSAGLIENLDSLTTELLQQGHSFGEMTSGGINSVELAAKLINTGKDLVDGFDKMFDKIHGSATLLLLTWEGIYAARDRLGRYPLVVGERGGDFAVATESSSFLNLGFEVIKFLEPGEVVLIDKNGLKQKASGRPNSQVCAFLWIYTGYPASSYEGINVELVRENCGRFLAKGDNIQADLVAGVPDSGVGHAIGYSMESGLPHRRPLTKYTPGYGRSYTPPSQEIRDLVATMKLIPIKEIICGNRIVLCEDSIVRGTQLKNYTLKKLWENGAKEVHIRPACPPLMFPCKFALSTRSISELAARRAIRSIEGRDVEDVSEYLDPNSEKYARMVEWVRRELGATTLKYQTLKDMIQAIGLPREKLCLHCWSGE
jgi:amidophosphoribosyltransferase